MLMFTDRDAREVDALLAGGRWVWARLKGPDEYQSWFYIRALRPNEMQAGVWLGTPLNSDSGLAYPVIEWDRARSAHKLAEEEGR